MNIGRWIRTQDLVWLLLFGALHAVSPVRNSAETEILVALALFQNVSPRVSWFNRPPGTVVAILIKLFLGWLLMGVTYGVASSYFLILLLPVVAAATTLGPLGASAITLLASLAYLSFFLFLDWNAYAITPDQARELGLRVLFLPLVGFLTYQLAESNRAAAHKYQETAEQLEAANRGLRAAETAVRRADRLAALGQLTAGLAHELRNPLGTIKNSAELLSKRVASGDDVSRELAGYISTDVDRTNTLVTRFLDFARPLRPRVESVPLSEVLDRAIDGWNRRNPAPAVTVFKNYSLDVRRIPADADLLEQAFFNLIANAAEATAPGGVVTVKTRVVDSMVEIAVIDRGTGIARADRESIFNPFFTTKTDGVGLGLAIVSKIVEEHNGRIEVDTAPGEGSVFRVWLPMSGSTGNAS